MTGDLDPDRRALLEALERSTLAGLAAVDAGGCLRRVNATFCAMVGWSEAELLGRRAPFPYWPPEELPAIERAFAATLAGEAPRRGFELRFARKSGERFWARIVISPLSVDEGARGASLMLVDDLTEQKRSEDELARVAAANAAKAEADAARRRLETILEHMPVGVMIAEAPSGKTIYANSYARQIYGGSIQAPSVDAYARTWKVWDVAGKLLSSEEIALARAVRGELVEHAEIIFQRPDGERRYAQAKAAPIRDDDGHVIAAVAAYFDSTEAHRARAERIHLAAEVRERELRFRTLAEAISDIVWTADARGEIREDSPSWRRFTGLALEAWLGTRGFAGVPDDDRAHAEAAWRRAVDTCGRYEASYRLRRHDGVLVPVAATAVPVRNDDGSVREWVGYIVDISAPQRAERRAQVLDRATSALLADVERGGGLEQLAYAVVPDLADWCTVYVRTPDDGLEPVVVATEDRARAAAALALLRAHPIPRDMSWGVPQAVYGGHTEVDNDLAPAAIEAAATDAEHAAQLRDVGIVAHLAVPLRARERVIGCLALAHTTPGRRFTPEDVSFAEELAIRAALGLERAQLLAAAEDARTNAERANAAKDQFLAMLGHELRNPLAPMRTALDLLRGKGRDDRELVVFGRQLGHMVRLVDDLLDVSRIVRGSIELERSTIDVASALDKAVEMARPLVDQRKHHLSLEVASGLCVDGDPARLAQVFANLLTNAAKYTPPSGRIDVRAWADARDVVVSVHDDGIGIDAELLPRIWDTFAQGPQPSDRALGGLGLGLSIVRSLVALHGGSVTAASDGLGRGSTFEVRLPRVHRAEPATRPSSPATERTGGRVLVVDDNADAAELLSEALRTMGYDTAVSTTGAEALSLLPSFRPAVALLDLGLPVMDGYELARRMRRELHDDVRLIAVTGYGQDRDRERTRAAGFDAHLVKPVKLDQLQRLLASVLGPPAGEVHP